MLGSSDATPLGTMACELRVTVNRCAILWYVACLHVSRSLAMLRSKPLYNGFGEEGECT
jgi:phosphatidate phosphatase PAH1